MFTDRGRAPKKKIISPEEVLRKVKIRLNLGNCNNWSNKYDV